jgi:adenosylhomocysteine nucleosidase
LSEDLAPGKAYLVSGVIDARTGERFETAKARSNSGRKKIDAAKVKPQNLWLVTDLRVADADEKKRLASTYSATLVDMEAAAIARLAQMRGIPFYCIKGISDGYSDQLPDFNRFITPDGKFRLAPCIVFALLHPRHWPALIRMGENSNKAARSIAQSLLDLLDEKGPLL